MTTDPLWLARLLPSADSWYPTGAYSHSFGLEGMVQAGWIKDRNSLQGYLLDVLGPALVHIELPLAAQAWHLAETTNPGWKEFENVCRLGHALRGTRELREASHRLGKQRLELASDLYPESPLPGLRTFALEGGWPLPYPVILGAEGQWAWQAPLDPVLTLLAVTALSGAISSSMKLIRMGQRSAQNLLHCCLKDVPAWCDKAQKLKKEELGWSFPWVDIASARHETAESRLFIS
jgi:urease accessory protein